MNEEEFRKIFSIRLTEQRKANNMTQLQLAEALNYTDKAVSKWERAESVPDAFIIIKIAELFKVSPDYLMGLSEENKGEEKEDNAEEKPKKHKRTNPAVPVFVPIISAFGVLFAASVIFLALRQFPMAAQYAPFVYVGALPAVFIVFTVFSFIWWKHISQFISVSGLIWSIGGVAYGAVEIFADRFRFEHIFTSCGILELICILAFAFVYFLKKYKQSSATSESNGDQ